MTVAELENDDTKGRGAMFGYMDVLFSKGEGGTVLFISFFYHLSPMFRELVC